VGDPACREVFAEVAGGELAAVVAAEGEPAGRDGTGEQPGLDAGDRFFGSGAQVDAPAGDLAGAAVDGDVEIDPAVGCGPDLGHVQVPELVGAGDPEEAWPATAVGVAGALQQPVLAHDSLHPLAVHRLAQLAAGQGGDHAGAVGRVRLRDLDDRLIAGATSAGASTGGAAADRPVDRLARHLQHARHDRGPVALGDQGAGPGDALVHSQPRNASPARSSS
jgi:hypothetical protein